MLEYTKAALNTTVEDLKRFFYTCTHINHPITSQISDWMKFIESQPEDYN